MSLVTIVAVPLVTAFIGWFTNWAAIKMIFEPAQFVGVGPIGWQGIVHRLAPKLAKEIASTTSTVLRPSDMLARLDTSGLRELLGDRLDPALEKVVSDIAELLSPGLWDEMAPEARIAVLDQVRDHIHGGADDLITSLRQDIDEIVELEPLIITALTGENTRRLAALTQEIGGRELSFIILYGGVFGLIVGITQLGALGIMGQWWIMPVVGLLTGAGTNWLALQMIFRPLEPTKILGLVNYQGMFPARQAEISTDYGRIAAAEVFTPTNMLRLLVEGPTGVRIIAAVLETLQARIKMVEPLVSALTGRELDETTLGQLQAALVAAVTDPDLVDQDLREGLEADLAEQMAVSETIRERLASLPKEQFERLLRGIFEEDEFILVVIGAGLGFAVGLLQAAIVLNFG